MGFFSKIVGNGEQITGCTDVPVDNVQKDRFDIGKYINGLSAFIMHCETPMTISIQGDWGSGKTSMMSMIQTNMEKEQEKIVWPIWFNTWQFSQFQLGNSLAISMMEVLLQSLDGDNKIISRITGLAKNVFLTATELSAGSRISGKVEKVINTSFNYVNEILELKNQFQKVVEEKLAKEHRERVVVFVDDLDRLDPSKAVELLEVLKLFLDCEKCVFVLAVDYEVVTLGIKQKYGSDVNAEKGKSFFDKIIQLPFKMPVAQYNIQEYVKSMMKNMLIDTNDENVKLFSSLIRTSIGLNPRSMKRLFNTYQLLDIITKETISYIPVDIRQRILFSTVCMQMSFDALYDYLSQGKIEIDTLQRLAELDDKSIQSFLADSDKNSSTDEDNNNDNILNEIFDETTNMEEMSKTIQRLPAFITPFLKSLHKDESDELTEAEANYLVDIIRCSAVTSLKTEIQEESSQVAFELRHKNRALAKNVNELLNKLGNFKIYQSRQRTEGIISSMAESYLIFFNRATKSEYKFQYRIDYIDKNIRRVDILLNGCKQNPKDFCAYMGENPLDYEQNPMIDEENGWYFYNNILKISDADDNIEKQIANAVKEAHKRLLTYLKSK